MCSWKQHYRFLSKQPDNPTGLTANHLPLPGSLMALSGERGVDALCAHLSLLLSLYGIYAKRSIRSLLSRSLHLHCSFPPRLPSLRYSHSLCQPPFFFLLHFLPLCHFAYYEFHYHYYHYYYSNCMQLCLKHMCHDNNENNIGLDKIFCTGNKKIIHNYFLTSVTAIHNVLFLCCSLAKNWVCAVITLHEEP